MGCLVGLLIILTGERVGLSVLHDGFLEGLRDGLLEGLLVGLLIILTGERVGLSVGWSLNSVGIDVGIEVGTDVG